jgi:hypothetical protein
MGYGGLPFLLPISIVRRLGVILRNKLHLFMFCRLQNTCDLDMVLPWPEIDP